MKKLILSLVLMAGFAAALTGCKNNEPEKKPDTSSDPSEQPKTPASLADVSTIYIYGSATEAGWDISKAMEFSDNGGGLYSWQGYLAAGSPFRFPLQKTADWPCLMVDEDGETLVFGNSEEDLVVYTVSPSGTYDIVIDARDVEHPSVSVDLVSIDLNELEITELYMLGEACPTGWALNLMEAFTNNDGVFTWEGPLQAGKRFRFPLQKIPDPPQWWPCLMLGPDGKVLYGMGDEDESNVPVAEDGVYLLTIDTRNRDNMTWTIELKSAGLPDPEITELYLLGDAAPGGWALDAAPAFTNNDGVFVWEGKLRASGVFRFNTTNLNFFPAIVKEIATGKPVYAADWDETLYEQFSVDKDGIYQIVVNAKKFDDISVTITFVGDTPVSEYPIEELYLLGDATDAGWSIDDMPAFAGDKGVFTLTANLKATGGFRFLTQKVGGMWFPAIAKEKATGKAVYVDNGQWDDAVYEHFTVAADGTYEIVVTAKKLEDITVTITQK